MRISGTKPKGKNTMKGKKNEKKCKQPHRDFNLHSNFLQRKVKPHTTGSRDHCTIRFSKLIILKYFSLPFTLFQPCRAVFIMNSKKHLRKNSLNEYSKPFRLISTFIHSRGGGGRDSHTLLYGYVPPNGVVILKHLIQNGVSISEAFSRTGMIFQTHESSSFVSSHFKLFEDRLLLKKRFNTLTSKLLYSCCTLCFSVQGGRILARAASADSAILDKQARGSLERVHNVPEGDGEGLKRKGRGRRRKIVSL